jgi:hypothetical protein
MLKKPREKKPGAISSATVTRPARIAKPKKPQALGARGTMRQSKSDHVLSLLKQASGATLDELMKATKWQAHSVRGFLSGAVKKRKGLTVLSGCDGEGRRRYRIAAGAET